MDLIVGLLGILKAGGAYLPLDRTHPEERLGFILEDAGVREFIQAHPSEAATLTAFAESIAGGHFEATKA